MIRYLIIFLTDLFVGVGAVSIQQVGIMHFELRSECKVCSDSFRVDKKCYHTLATEVVSTLASYAYAV